MDHRHLISAARDLKSFRAPISATLNSMLSITITLPSSTIPTSLYDGCIIQGRQRQDQGEPYAELCLLYTYVCPVADTTAFIIPIITTTMRDTDRPSRLVKRKGIHLVAVSLGTRSCHVVT